MRYLPRVSVAVRVSTLVGVLRDGTEHCETTVEQLKQQQWWCYGNIQCLGLHHGKPLASHQVLVEEERW